MVNYFDVYIVKTTTASYRVSACTKYAAMEKVMMIENDRHIKIVSFTKLT